MIIIQKNTDLSAHSTMRLGGTAKCCAHVVNEQELLEAYNFAQAESMPYKIIGKGSNIVWSGDFEGLLIVNEIMGFEISGTTVTIGSGEYWDTCVQKTVDAGLSGIEFLSLIPGTAGAVPVQNVGAYGAEIADTLVSVRAYDTESNEFVELLNSECDFGYRTSRFNQQDAGRFLITSIVLELFDTSPVPPFYKALEEYFNTSSFDYAQDDKLSVTNNDYTSQIIRDAVIAIRQSKLPDPQVVPNCGSFFKNPIVSKEKYAELQKTHPDIPGWEHEGQMKVPAAWLLDCLGFKNYSDPETGMATYEKHPLVVINKSAKSIEDLHVFKQKLVDAVDAEFGVELEQEPELV